MVPTVQAALERGDASIEYRWIRMDQAQREARMRGVDLESLLHYVRRFERGVYHHH